MSEVEKIEEHIRAWIVEQCKRKGFSRNGFATFAGLEATVPSKITRRERTMRAGEFVLARRYFGSDPFHDVEGVERSNPVRVIETGTFRAEARLDQIADIRMPSGLVPPQGIYPFLVRGPGMETLRPRPVMDGDLVLCEPRAIGEIRDGDIVVVDRRATASLDLWERVLVVATVEPGAVWFSHRSREIKRDPIRYEVTLPTPDIKVIGMVTAIVTMAASTT
jgi:hypothetical protein